MKVKDILEHFLARADWVKREITVDRVIMGDGEVEVESCLVSWMPSFGVLRHVVARGARLLVCHEPTFWNHRDQLSAADPRMQEKLAYIQDHKHV